MLVAEGDASEEQAMLGDATGAIQLVVLGGQIGEGWKAMGQMKRIPNES